eukprot:5814477-Alexandrium_andersonii.AAC.1
MDAPRTAQGRHNVRTLLNGQPHDALPRALRLHAMAPEVSLAEGELWPTESCEQACVFSEVVTSVLTAPAGAWTTFE